MNINYHPVLKLMISALAALAVGATASNRFGSTIPQLNNLTGISLACLTFIVLMLFVGGKLSPASIRSNLQKIGLHNKAGEVPFLISIREDNTSEHGIIIEFENRGIPRETFEAKKADIEAALDIRIVSISDGKNRRRVVIRAVRAEHGLPDFIKWDNGFRSNIDFEIILGKSLTGYAKINLLDTPHMLIGGATGSGKTVLLKNILAQCLYHGAAIYIADFKGGVDFPPIWHKKCQLIYDEHTLITVLEDKIVELEARKAELKRTGCANIAEYNRRVRNIFKPIIIACDEIAELLDPTGRDKEEKAIIKEITGHLATIARQGRAFGLYLVLATQRASVDVVPPHVKSNIPFRACGRADNTLSMIVLDNTEATDVVPKDAKGRFLASDGTVFQGFWFDDRNL